MARILKGFVLLAVCAVMGKWLQIKTKIENFRFDGQWTLLLAGNNEQFVQQYKKKIPKNSDVDEVICCNCNRLKIHSENESDHQQTSFHFL